MTYLISGILIVVNYIYSIIKSRKSIMRFLLLVMMWILFWGNFYNADYLNYSKRYEYLSQIDQISGLSEFGYSLIMKIASGFGLEYYQFLMVVSFLGLFLISSTVKRYTSKPQLVYVLYFIYPFLLDIVQVRHFLAMSVVFFCLRYLENEGIRNTIKFVIGIFIAFSIHYISIIFIPLIILRRMNVEKIYIIVFIFLAVGIPLAYTNLFQIFASYFVPIQKVESYFLNRAKFGFVIQFFIQTVILIMVSYSKKFLEKHKSSNNFIELIYKTNIYLLILFPLYIINGTFERAFRMMIIPNYIVFSLIFSKIKKIEKVIFPNTLLLFVVALFIIYLYLQEIQCSFQYLEIIYYSNDS